MTTRDRFTENLAASGLLSDSELRAFTENLSHDENAQDARRLARDLVRRGILTRYQAAAVYHGKLKRLVLDEYVLLEILGAGGMGLVFRAQHRRMKRTVAIKLLPPSVTRSPTALSRFQREVEAAAKLIHPNIVTAFDAGVDNGIHYLVMQFVEGRNLADVVRSHGPLSLRRALRYVEQAARGLQHAHAEGLVHRDIKPSNLLVDRDDVVKILDMGLARFNDHRAADEVDAPPNAGETGELTQVGAIFGTPDFMSPEQTEDTRLVDHRADIYSLGCTLYFLLTGQTPFGGRPVHERIEAHRNVPAPSLRTLRPDAPEALESLFQRMVAKSPEERFSSIAALLDAIAACGIELVPPQLPAGVSTEAALVAEDVPLLRALTRVESDTAAELDVTRVIGEPRRKKSPARKRAASAVPQEKSLSTGSFAARLVPVGSNRRALMWSLGGFLALALGLSALAPWLAGLQAKPLSPGLLKLRIEPAEAVVFIDGRRLSIESPTTEGLVAPLGAGRHVLAISKAGFQSFVQEIEVASGKTETIEVMLQPVSGAVPRESFHSEVESD